MASRSNWSKSTFHKHLRSQSRISKTLQSLQEASKKIKSFRLPTTPKLISLRSKNPNHPSKENSQRKSPGTPLSKLKAQFKWSETSHWASATKWTTRDSLHYSSRWTSGTKHQPTASRPFADWVNLRSLLVPSVGPLMEARKPGRNFNANHRKIRDWNKAHLESSVPTSKLSK